MKQMDSLNKRLNKRLASLVMLSVLSVPWVASTAGNSVVANNMLPGNGKVGDVVAGSVKGGFADGSWAQGNQMIMHQTTQNAIVTWDSFSIGANASVTINGDHNNFNMLNYVTGSESSQIYGKLNSYVNGKQGGNIYLVNPNGVQIGNSAEINVGSLHIANKKIDNITTWTENTDIANALKQNKAMSNAELMSLGYINASKLVFEGERVVIDMDRLSGLDTTKADALTIVSKPYDGKSVGDNRKYDVVLGSSTPKNAAEWGKYMVFADVSDNGGEMDTATSTSWHGTTNVGNPDAPNQTIAEFFTYRWIKDGKELEKIGQTEGWGMGDHYALRYSIDLTGSDQTPIGNTSENAFKGKFDGLDNSIFGLNINNSDNKYAATGLFGFTDGAIMGNVTLIAGNDGVSIQGGDNDTGAFIGHAVNTTVKGVNSTLKVSGKNNVGGIIGYAKDDTGRTYSFADASGSAQPDSRSSELSNLTNTGNVSGFSNVGGLVGYMNGGKLSNDEENRVQYKGSYNLGKITGIDKGTNYSSNIGGMIGKAENATVGGTKNTLINYNTVEGGYNVGGIVGSISNTTVANASNEGVVKANGYTIDSYIYHTDYTGSNWQNNNEALPGTHKAEVRAANVGGIVGSSAGSELKDVTNKADVSSALVKKTANNNNDPRGFDHYAAGNVGGIVGRAEDSNITNANNVESNIRGAMNVGGIVGYFGSTDATNKNKKDYRILNAINNGGDIMATGGIKKDGSFTQEITHKETYITGNIGGIAGYLYGVPVRIEAGGNRGDVHTAADTSKRTSQAVNVGGIVGKIDMPKKTDSDGNRLTDDNRLAIIKGNATDAAGKSGYASAAVSSSYNTGNVTGYTNIGGIGGFAYNGSIAASYNVGDIKTTRHDAASTGVTPINMGGILGESTEMAIGRVIIYDTYNKGTIGDSSYNMYGRHVGGIVGRLSGIVEKSYNNGDIYNGFNVVGGIAGYWYSGYLKNVFNTGNITVYNKNNAPSQVGGIVGSVDLSGGNLSSGSNAALSISNAYNLGSLRSFMGGGKYNEVGGILGGTFNYSGTSNRLKISNAYTMGNIYVDKLYAAGGFVGDIVGAFDRGTNRSFVDFENVYYIRPQADNGYFDLASAPNSGYLQKNAKVIDYDKLNDPSQWSKFSFSTQTNGTIEGATDDNWRMSDGSLPILNAFLSGSHKYFSDNSNWQEFIKDNKGANVQYGTAYDPLLTIINTKKDLTFNWSDMDLKNNGSLAVFGLPNADNTLRYTPGLTLNNVEITNSTHIFGGTIYSDGVLKLNAKDDLQGGLRFGMDSMLYGSDVVLNTNSSLELSGSVISTGNHNALSSFNPEKSLQHGININAADLTVYGKLITKGKEGEKTDVIVPGINYGYLDTKAPDKNNVSDKNKAMTSQGMEHAYRLKTATAKTGNITISTMENTLADGTHMSGSANLLYGNYKKGKIETKGNLTVSSSGDILVDSDLDVTGSIKLEGAEVPDGSGYLYVNNITLDLSNIGGELKGNDKATALHNFIDAHKTAETGIYGNNNSGFSDDKHSMKITFDLWDDDYEVGGVKGNLKYTKYDLKNDDNTTVKLTDKLQSLYVQSDGENYTGDKIRNVIYTWISNAEELNSVQRVAQNMTDRDALSYNYAMKNDIDASGLVDAAGESTYNTIGSGDTAFKGTFDGNGHTIVGLQANGGLFGKLGNDAVVKNLNIASSVFTGKETGDSVGAVAAENNGGQISGISGYGNTVKGSGGYIGGLVGKNYGSITDSDDQSTIIAGADTVAGGIAGMNGGTVDGWPIGYIENVQSNSAVTTGDLGEGLYASNLGGIVGKNEKLSGVSWIYNINNVSAHGVTGKTGNTKTSGGIVGTNECGISNAYNESIIHGSENIGGIAGSNAMVGSDGSQATLENIANAVEIIGDAGSQNIGGLVGMQDHATTNQGRNTGAITGCTNVGGMVGYNTADSYLNNLENSPQATITGITNVGGIAGVNEGEISADNQLNLVNSGKIYGWKNVGGIAGKNSGKIDNVNSNINLYVIDEATRNALKGTAGIDANAQFFGGVTGENVGIITNATNRARVDAAQASYVGGIVGRNTSEGGKVGKLLGMGNSNEGFVIGKNYVGGVIGKNEVAITGTSEQSVGIVNSGTVIALAGGAGGIIGENSADITHVIMKNEGEVHGNASIEGSTEENGTGGIIGVNGYKADGTGANISNSSLMNRVNGNVSGVANVGGIIGINHGVITGGRDDKNNYYKYQIYNNGTIQAGSYDATNGTITAYAGENIGGLLGNNSGTLTAGYNTGVVDAGQSSNVGGIAGTNSGTLDQVFNSVVTVTKTETGATDADGRKLYNYTYTDGGAISGASNVGGIVGSNTAGGQLSNAYSTTAVAGNNSVANIVGSNAGQVSNIYSYAANGNTNVNHGTVTNSYIINADGTLQNGNDAKKLDSYDFDDKDKIWKLYDKRTNPLLKVFLTKVTVAPDLQQGWVYDATNHLDIHGWINSGKLTTNDPANDAFAAYKNNNSLLQGEDLKNVGDYSSWLWSGQIASGGEVGPNNLGYDCTVGDITITKKVLNVTGNTVNRTYGDLRKDHDYALSIDGFNNFNDAMKAELDGNVTITDSQNTIQNNQDTGIITVGDEKRTDNKGSYTWHAGVKLDNSLIGNYEFIDNGVSSTTTTVHGVSNVLARKVYLNDINANLTYGSGDAINNHINGVVSIKDLASAIVYGDDVKLADGAVVNVKDGSEYAVNKGERNTADVDTYDNSLKIDNAALTGDASKLGNYELVNDATGSIKVDQAEMHVKLNNVERTYGNAALINGTSYGVNGLTGNVNGDNYAVGDVKVTVTGDGALTGKSTGKVTNDAGDTYKWNANVVAANDKLQQNYKLVVDDGGASVVNQATLQVSLNEVVRTYGNAAITSGSYSASGITGLVNGDSYDASVITVNKTSDGAIDGVSGSKVTNDADNYTWSGTLTTDNAALKNNYKLELKGDGKSVVGKATLKVGLSDVYRTYGNATITNGSYSAGNITGLVNGDSYNANDFKVTFNSDGAIAGVTGDRVTNDYGEYTWNGTIEAANAGLNKNYDLVVNANGKSYVDKAILNVSLNDVVRTYGDTSFTDGTGYGIKDHDALVNGDKGTVSLNKDAITDGGLVDNNSKTNNKGDYKWNVGENGIVADGVTNFAKNYDIQVTAGNSKVNAKKIYLNNINASTTYGSKDGLQADGNVSLQDNSIVYGDKVSLKDGASVSYKADGEYAANKGDRDTADAGTYKADVAVTGAELVGNELGNYELVNNATGVITVKKATLNVGLNDVVRTYGNADFTKGNYGASSIEGLVNGDSYNASAITVNKTSDGAVDNLASGKTTNDAGEYSWTGSASTTNESLNKNYDLVVNGNGKSTVEKANLVVNLNDISRVYGNLDAKDYSNAYTFGANAGLVNGDNGLVIKADKDGAIVGGTLSNVEKTNNVGSYEWNGTASGVENLNTNYNVQINAGKSDVTKANLVVNLNDITRVYGNLEAKDYSNVYTFGTGAGLVNGDNGLVINADKDGAIAEGSVTDVKKTNNVGSYSWSGSASGVDKLDHNYNVTVNNGKSDVTKANLVVNLKDITRVYGNLDAKDYSNAYTFGANAGLVNGDNGLVINANKDGAIAGGTLTNVEKTNNVGSYSWSGSASGVDKLNTNYDVQINAGKSDVTKANLVVNLNDITRVYGNLDAKDYSNAYTFGANAGLVNGDNGLVINANADGAIAEGSVTDVKKTNNVGKYSWSGSASGVDNLEHNYNVTVNNGKSDVTKANLVVNLNDITRVYGNLDAKDYSNAYTFGANAGLVNGDNGLVINANADGAIAEGSLTDVKKTNNVGSYEWNGTASGVDNLNTNYDVTVNAGKSDVTKANLVVNLNDITRVYGNLDAKDYSNAYTFGANAGLVNGDNGLVINADKDGAIAGGTLTNVEKTNNVGSYEWNGTASGVENLNTNYDVTVNAGKSDVTKAQLVVNLNDITRVYGNLDAKDYSNAYTFGNNAGLVNGDNGLVINANKDGAIVGGTLTNVEKTNNVGSYEWNGTASGVENLNHNYNVTVNNGKSDVTKANLVVNLNDITRVYGNLDAKDYSNAYTFGNNAGLVNGDNGLVINADKDGAIADGTLTNVEKTNNVGNYEWNGTASGVENLNTNYNVQINAGKSDVTKANLVVNLNDITRVYGNLDAKDYSNAYTFGANAGLVNGDNGLVIKADKDGAIVGGTLSNVEKTNNVGSYEWNGTASGVDKLDHNYNVTVNNGKSDVTKANLVVNLNDITRVYGNLDAKDYSNAYTFGANAGLVNGDNGLVINANKDGAIAEGSLTDVKKTNNVGSYEWNGTASGVDNLNTNYDVTVNAGKSDVTKANLVVNLKDITRVYGNLDAKDYSNAYTFGANAGLVNGDNGLVINAKYDGAIAEGSVTDVKKTSNVGNYSWSGTASGVENLNANYDVTINVGKSDVTKANLVVNLNDISRVYGNLDAKDYSNAYTFGANAGLVNGDNGLVIKADKDGAIAGGTLTNVEKTNNVGSYEWNGTASGVDNLNTNYDVTVNAGKSDVTKANLVVNLNDITRVYGNLDAKDYSNAYTFGTGAGLVNGDNGLVINADKDGAIAGGTLTNVEKTNNVGSYEWNGTASGVENLNTNYNVQINAGKSDVTKANLVVNLNDITRVYGNLEANDYSNAFTFGNNAGLVNGDNGLVIDANADGAIAKGSVSDVKKTNNVGSYEWNGTASGVDNLNTNYDVTVNAGKSDVTKAKLTFVVDDKTITQGVPAKYTGKANGLTNGDTLVGIGVGGYELDSSVNPLIVGVYEDKIGVLINGSLHLTGGDGLIKNYKVEIDPGTLTVLASFNPADDYWFGTAPWDKERNLRERKAEFHYVAGGMSL